MKWWRDASVKCAYRQLIGSRRRTLISFSFSVIRWAQRSSIVEDGEIVGVLSGGGKVHNLSLWAWFNFRLLSPYRNDSFLERSHVFIILTTLSRSAKELRLKIGNEHNWIRWILFMKSCNRIFRSPFSFDPVTHFSRLTRIRKRVSEAAYYTRL